MDLSFLLGAGNGAGGVQMPNMQRDQAAALTLAQLSRQNRIGADQEQETMRARQEQDAYRQALPALLKAGFSREAIQAAIESDPRIGGTVLKEADARRKTALDEEKTGAEIAEKRTNATSKAFKDISNVAFGEAQRPDHLSISRISSVARQYGLPLPRFAGDERNPDDVKSYITAIGNAGFDAKDQVDAALKERKFTADEGEKIWRRQFDTGKQAETGRHNRATEGIQGGTLAESRRHNQASEGMQRETRDAGRWVNDLPNSLQVNMQTGESRPITADGAPLSAKADAKRTNQARQALRIIEQAEPIIEKATNSYAGAAYDQGARVFGASTAGADAAAELQALEGALMMAQPRMEGPQSNLDVQLYKQMAAKIGDSTVPKSQKKAALAEIKKLHERYAGSAGGATGDFGSGAPAGGAPAKGEKRDGYTFMGGDPAVKGNWRKD